MCPIDTLPHTLFTLPYFVRHGSLEFIEPDRRRSIYYRLCSFAALPGLQTWKIVVVVRSGSPLREGRGATSGAKGRCYDWPWYLKKKVIVEF